jgi:hypothetical protein
MSGHGHVTPRPDGLKARCGGPALCADCQAEERTLGFSSTNTSRTEEVRPVTNAAGSATNDRLEYGPGYTQR